MVNNCALLNVKKKCIYILKKNRTDLKILNGSVQ